MAKQSLAEQLFGPRETPTKSERYVETGPPEGVSSPPEPKRTAYQKRRAGWEEYGFDYSEVTVTHRTMKAIKVVTSLMVEYWPTPSEVNNIKKVIRKAGKEFWVPYTQIHPESEVPKASSGILIVKPWFAQQMGWLDSQMFTKYENL